MTHFFKLPFLAESTRWNIIVCKYLLTCFCICKMTETSATLNIGVYGECVMETFVPFDVLNSAHNTDMGIYLEEQNLSDVDDPSTPDDTDTSDPFLEDSGFNDSLGLQCQEDLQDWKLTKSYLTPGGHECRHFVINARYTQSDEHRGFEEHLQTIYQHRLSIEYKFQVTACLDNQPDVSPGVRGLLVSWMTGLHHQLGLCQDTLFIAVNIVDRVLDIMQASRDYLQLLGITSILIASKAEEVHPPEITDLLNGCTDTYTRDQVKQLEHVVLNAIRFDILVPTSQFFLEYFASRCIAMCSGFRADLFRQARAYARYLLELSLQDYDLCQFRPSVLALCMWKVAVEDMKADVDHFLLKDLFLTPDDYKYIYSEVNLFTQNLKLSYPDIKSLCGGYVHLYGKD